MPKTVLMEPVATPRGRILSLGLVAGVLLVLSAPCLADDEGEPARLELELEGPVAISLETGDAEWTRAENADAPDTIVLEVEDVTVRLRDFDLGEERAESDQASKIVASWEQQLTETDPRIQVRARDARPLTRDDSTADEAGVASGPTARYLELEFDAQRFGVMIGFSSRDLGAPAEEDRYAWFVLCEGPLAAAARVRARCEDVRSALVLER